MRLTLFDTSVCTENLGDFIIMDAVRDNINKLFPDAMILHTATHEKISHSTYQLVKNSDYSFVGGTNLISSNMNIYNQWKVNLYDGLFLKDIILMGVGWWQYQKSPNFYTRTLLRSLLHKELLHSVRDSYTELMLKKAGFKNVINTSCATMWGLNEAHCEAIPKKKGERVVATLTDYKKNHEKDFQIIELLSKKYSEVYIWPQGGGDLNYIHSLNVNKRVKVLPASLDAYNDILGQGSIDFVGTRLHAGIRALQKKCRTIILGVDNRAFEKAKDFNINVCPREDVENLSGLIDADLPVNIKLPLKNIEIWKAQFR